MRRITRSLALSSILVATTALPLVAQIDVRFGDVPPTTVLTATQREFAESYLAAVTGMDTERYEMMLHPTTLACMNSGNADYFKMIFERRTGKDAVNPRLSVEKLPTKFGVIDAMNAQGWNYTVRPTHAFHIDLVSTGATQSLIIAFAVLDGRTWYEVLPCPSRKLLDEMKRTAHVASATEQKP
jgi:hypothetical protein